MLFKRNSFIVLSACLLFAQACRQKSVSLPDVNVEHQISPASPRVGPVEIVFRITDVSGLPITGARVAVEGNMTHAGMTPVFAEATEIGNGSYRARIELSMAGDWVVVARVTLANGRKLEYQFEIDGVTR